MTKQYWDFSYYEGELDIDSTIYASEEDIDRYVGKTVYWHELAGKHSEGEFILTKDMFKPAEIAEYGFNPLERVASYEEDLQEDGTLKAPEPPKPTQNQLDLKEMSLRYPASHHDFCNKLPDSESKKRAEKCLYDDINVIYKRYANEDLERYFHGNSFALGVFYKYKPEHRERPQEFINLTKGLPYSTMSTKEKYALRAMVSYMRYSSEGKALVGIFR